MDLHLCKDLMDSMLVLVKSYTDLMASLNLELSEKRVKAPDVFTEL